MCDKQRKQKLALHTNNIVMIIANRPCKLALFPAITFIWAIKFNLLCSIKQPIIFYYSNKNAAYATRFLGEWKFDCAAVEMWTLEGIIEIDVNCLT